jgi:alkylation response protein AidB-like acyl-CoA dehydrogenase
MSDLAAFRAAVRAFVAKEWPGQTSDKAQLNDWMMAFRKKAIDAGYILTHIPAEYGGGGKNGELQPAQKLIVADEFRKAGAATTPGPMTQGQEVLVPTLMAHGTEEQKRFFVPKSLSGEIIWAQGYSEPQAGSDLASLRTRAVLDGDHWVVNGHKVWNSNADIAHWAFVLVRTEPDKPKHKGISYLLIDLKTKGVTARPLRVATGARHFGELIFDDARVPAGNIIGARGDGWRVANSTLSIERNMISTPEETYSSYLSLVELAKWAVIDGKPAINNAVVQDRLLTIEGFVQSHRWAGYWQAGQSQRNESAGHLPMFNKLSSTVIAHLMVRLASELLGPETLRAPPPDDNAGDDPIAQWRKHQYWSIGYAIAGGSSNIQRNIIAEKALGLPRDARGN